jgi:plastocyanin
MTDQIFDRRTVLKTVGVGIIGSAAIPGLASAEGANDDQDAYGTGHGLDEFLNEEAPYKDGPIWDGEIVDMRGHAVADVAVGTMTSVNGAPIPAAPVAFDPMAVMISPGATVRWTWVSNPLDLPFPHDVTSLVNDDGGVVLKEDAGQRYHYHATYTSAALVEGLEEDINPTFEFTFDKRGNHLYYCTPHGAPFPLDLDGFGVVTNLVGMRGAVKVAGKAL